jgi:hypothetical protein
MSVVQTDLLIKRYLELIGDPHSQVARLDGMFCWQAHGEIGGQG